MIHVLYGENQFQKRQLIGNEDKLSFDMTHSFRSLAFYELLALNFFKLSIKNSDSIDFISYGMFEYNVYNNNKTPIIDQSHYEIGRASCRERV